MNLHVCRVDWKTGTAIEQMACKFPCNLLSQIPSQANLRLIATVIHTVQGLHYKLMSQKCFIDGRILYTIPNCMWYFHLIKWWVSKNYRRRRNILSAKWHFRTPGEKDPKGPHHVTAFRHLFDSVSLYREVQFKCTGNYFVSISFFLFIICVHTGRRIEKLSFVCLKNTGRLV